MDRGIDVPPAGTVLFGVFLQLTPVAAHTGLVIARLGRMGERLVARRVVGEAVRVLQQGVEAVHRVREGPGEIRERDGGGGGELVEDGVEDFLSGGGRGLEGLGQFRGQGAYEAMHAVEGVQEVETQAVVPDEALRAGEALGVGVGVWQGEVAEIEVQSFPCGSVVGVAEGSAVGESSRGVEDEAGLGRGLVVEVNGRKRE